MFIITHKTFYPSNDWEETQNQLLSHNLLKDTMITKEEINKSNINSLFHFEPLKQK